MMCSLHSREKAQPALLITSAEGTPEWVSSLEALKLAVGLCDFTCCQRNHKFGDKIVPCDRGITRNILERLIASKVKYLFERENIQLARLVHIMTQWWTRGPTTSSQVASCDSLTVLKSILMWDESLDGQDDTMPWVDRTGISILVYAMGINNINIVREILKIYESRKSHLLAWRFPEEGVVEVGIPGHSTCLYGAMCFASEDIVVALLEAGADVKSVDVMGNDVLIAACGIGRLDNVKMWLTRYTNWNINTQNTRFGSTALGNCLNMGPRKYELVKYLVDNTDVDMNVRTHSGASMLHLAADNEDADPKVVRYLLNLDRTYINSRKKTETMKWKLRNVLARALVTFKLTHSLLIQSVAEKAGSSPLYFAVKRGDLEVVEILLEHGADPSTKNDLGRDILS